MLSMPAEVILVCAVNLITGLGLVALGLAMVRRPERIWVGVRVAHDPNHAARVQRANSRTAPWILALGLVDILSGPAAVLLSLSPLVLAFLGLAILLLAILALSVAAFLSRPGA